MFHDFDRLVPGTFDGALWFVSVAALWVAWRLIPYRCRRTSHIVRFGLLVWIAAGWFWLDLIGTLTAAAIFAVILIFAMRGYPRGTFVPVPADLQNWERALRVGAKALVLLTVVLMFISAAYLSVYAWFATPSLADFGLFVEPSSADPQYKAGYLFYWLIGPFAVVIAAFGEWFRRPLSEDDMPGSDFYLRAILTVLVMMVFSWDAFRNPQRAIRAAEIDGYALAVKPPLPCPPKLVDCPAEAARLVAP